MSNLRSLFARISPWSTAAEESDSKFSLRLLALTIVGAASGIGIMGAFDAHKIPANMLSAREDSHSASVGDQMVMIYDNNKMRPCRAITNRFIYNDSFMFEGSSRRLYYSLGSSAPPPVDVGMQHYALGIPIPKEVIPGPYKFVATTDYYCGLESKLDPPSTKTEPADVTITRPTPDSPAQVVVTSPGEKTLIVPQGDKP